MEAEDFYASRYRSEPSRFVRSHEYKLPVRGGGVVERLAAAQRHAWIKKGRAEWSFLPMRNYDPVAAHAAKKNQSIDPSGAIITRLFITRNNAGPSDAVWCSFWKLLSFVTKTVGKISNAYKKNNKNT